MQKYSSNVIEKCLEKGNDYILFKFIEEISQSTRIIGINLIFLYFFKKILQVKYRFDEKFFWKLCNSKSFKSF